MDFNNLKKPQKRGVLTPAKTFQKDILTERIYIPVTPAEKTALEETARQDGRKTAPFLRHFLKQHKLI